ncbi:hypothetical protein ABTY96_02455 [Streptomyces sp. NPDC096057]|uniref:hypothetical protein n=1 Tax=Streptomyces sp. NPDC096057 TaxID=3155543 RepID=UPI0033247384
MRSRRSGSAGRGWAVLPSREVPGAVGRVGTGVPVDGDSADSCGEFGREGVAVARCTPAILFPVMDSPPRVPGRLSGTAGGDPADGCAEFGRDGVAVARCTPVVLFPETGTSPPRVPGRLSGTGAPGTTGS